MKKLGLAVAAAAMLGLFAGSASAGHNTGPSSKATFTHADVMQSSTLQLLAVELGRPVLRVAYGADSRIVDAFGDVIARAPSDQDAVLLADSLTWRPGLLSWRGERRKTAR